MKKILALLSIIILLISCTAYFDGSTAIQEVFARELYDEGVYLDKGGLTLIIKQDKSVTPLDYYVIEIQKLDEDDSSTIKVEYKDNYDIIKPLDIERGIYSFSIKGYKDGEVVSTGKEEGYVLSEANSTLTISVLAEGHTHNLVWQSDVTYHWKGCSLCSYTEANTKAEHTYPSTPESDGLYYCTVCGRSKPIDTSSGFEAKEGEIEPKGHYTGTKTGTTWTFTFVDDNTLYPSTVAAWFLNGKETTATTETTLKTTIETYRRVRVLCVFKNEHGYASYEVMIDGNWNNYEI